MGEEKCTDAESLLSPSHPVIAQFALSARSEYSGNISQLLLLLMIVKLGSP